MAIHLTRIPYRVWLLVAVLIAHVASAINPENYQDFVFEHVPTASFVIFIIAYERLSPRGPLSNASYTLIFIFMLMHVLGAHFLYQNVPYDDVAEVITGRTLSEMFGWERNHYDRFVHLMFGVLLVQPMFEFVKRTIDVARWKQLVVAVLLLAFFSHLYEWAEWALTAFMSPEAAENYNGQQGDMFDAQKDTALAFVGSVCSAIVIDLRARRRIGSITDPQKGLP